MRIISLFALIACVMVPLSSWTQMATYQTGFEATEFPPFAAGTYTFDGDNDIDDAGRWLVEEGAAAIQTAIFSAGSQALEIQASGSVNAPRSGEGAQEIWLQGRYRTTPQDTDPDATSLEASSALMYFNTTEGVKVYDGVDQQWEAIDAPVSSDTWYLITIRLDFSTQTWDIWVDNALKAMDVGFKDSSITTYNGFRCRSSDQASGYLDEFYVSEDRPSNIEPTPTPTPPALAGSDFLFYSIYWQDNRSAIPTPGANETDYFTLLNLNGADDDIEWTDILKFLENFKQQ